MPYAPPPSLREELAAATSLMDLARRLGAASLEQGAHLLRLWHDSRVRTSRTTLEQTVASLDAALFEAREGGGFLHLLDHHDLGRLVDLMETDRPLPHAAFLRGLCRRAIPQLFERTEDVIVLDRGMPIPFAERPLPDVVDEVTPHHSTLTRGGVLDRLGHALFEHVAQGPIRVELDFRSRHRLDEVTWAREKRLPRVATVHPRLADAQLVIGEIADEWFFDVRPASWDATEALARLEAVADAEIAVLPELSLPSPDALERALAEDPGRYPPLIVAGSAHMREIGPDGSEVRANEARVYLDGRLVAVHRKIHPFATRALNGHRREREWVEGITPEPKVITVLSGRHTHLAVAICADCNDENARVPSLLEAACVNLLLVPALTDRIGAFTATLSGIASRCQGVGVIVNGDRAPTNGSSATSGPFLTMVGVPRPAPRDQLRLYPERGGDPRGAIGVFDPNAELERAMEWRAEA